MSRAVLLLASPEQRTKATEWIRKAPEGTRLEFKAPRRTLPQNARLWAMLTDIATQATHQGRRYGTEEWKIIFLHALGRETRFLPSLDGQTFVPWGQSSSDLSKEEMTEMIDMMFAWGAENGVVFNEPKERAA